MKSKLAIVLIIFTIISFFLYRSKETKRGESTTERLHSGTIVSAVDNKPIEAVSIAIQGSNPKSLSNAQGEFAIMVLESQELVFKHAEYKTQVVLAKDAQNIKMEVLDATHTDEIQKQFVD
ncbi:MAG: hypothetical protein RL662_1639 [Bacteroidota bacterium]|jgi:hypothetical protein